MKDILKTAQDLHLEGNLSEAKKLYEEILKSSPENPEALHSFAIIEAQQGNKSKAEELIIKALKYKPDWPEAHNNLANIFAEQKKFNEAVKNFQKALSLNPKLVKSYFNLGNIFIELGNYDLAIENFSKAVELKPDWPEACYKLANSYMIKGLTASAINYFQKVLQLKKDFPEVYYNLGIIFQYSEKFQEAIENYSKAVLIRPEWPEVYSNMGNTYVLWRKPEEAEQCYKKSIEVRPGFAEGYYNLANVQVDLWNQKEAIINFQKAIELRPGWYQPHSNLIMTLQYQDGLTQEEWKSALENFKNDFTKLNKRINFTNRPLKEKRLKIGYVSPDFISHSVASFFEPLLRSHNKEEFEIFCYSDVEKPDNVTERIRKTAGCWREIKGLSDQEVTGLIIKDEIDILVDLAGHTGNNRLTAFADKPAPVQVTWLGFPASTGLDCIDFKLSDQWLTPKPSGQNPEEFFSEKIWNLNRAVHCYQPPEKAKEIGPLPMQKNGYLTFGSFNNLNKISPQLIELWSALLKEIPESKLILKAKHLDNHKVREKILQHFLLHKISPTRIEFFDWFTNLEKHLDLYNLIDLALDSFPYNGATMTLEALWMGVPVLTLCGDRSAARYGYSFLTATGLEELISFSKNEFIKKVKTLVENPEKLMDYRLNLRTKLLSSVLCDNISFAGEIEAAFREMWQIWCIKQI